MLKGRFKEGDEVMVEMPEEFESDIEEVKRRLREGTLTNLGAALAVVLLASLKGQWINVDEIVKVLRELGYDVKTNSIRSALYKVRQEGLLKSKRLGRKTAYFIPVEEEEVLGAILRRITGEEIREKIVEELLKEIRE
ncbi:MAG: hypothetical protein ACXQTC_05050 [Methanopyraceae archaeon]